MYKQLFFSYLFFLCLIWLKKAKASHFFVVSDWLLMVLFCRGERIRTFDPLLPKQVR